MAEVGESNTTNMTWEHSEGHPHTAGTFTGTLVNVMTFARTLVNVREVLVYMGVGSVRQSFAILSMKARACFWYAVELA